MKVQATLFFVIVLSCAAVAGDPGAPGDLYVCFTAATDRLVGQFDSTGVFEGVFSDGGTESSPSGYLVFAPNGNLLVGNHIDMTIDELDGDTGQFIRHFATGLNAPEAMRFGEDGNLYVSEFYGDRVSVFEWETGSLLHEITDPGLYRCHGLDFGPDGNLFVAGNEQNGIVMEFSFNGTAWVKEGVFTTAGIDYPGNILFLPDGSLLVCNGGNTNNITRFDSNGAFFGAFTDSGHLNGPYDLHFGPDGNLYVTSYFDSRIVVFDALGSFLFDFFTAPLNKPASLDFKEAPVVEIQLNMNPESLKLTSNGKYVTGYIYFIEDQQADYAITDLDPYSVLLTEVNGTAITPVPIEKYSLQDQDEDDLFETLMVKFDRSSVAALLGGGTNNVTVTGYLLDGVSFKGSDSIRGIE